jgi:SPX domain protein involved in polyphosphate accumulation
MYHHQAQVNRFELKYIINEGLAPGIREFLRCHLELDEYARPDLANNYVIHSLYLDSPGLDLCLATLHGHKNRFKLRIRFYDDDPLNPVFFEVKQRLNDIINKDRVAVHRRVVHRLLDHNWPEPSDLCQNSPKNFAALKRFCSLRNVLQADHGLFVSYLREAWVSAFDDQVRVTFDHQLQASHQLDQTLRMFGLKTWQQPRIEGIVLELKFCDRFPLWMNELVQEFDLERTVMAKYVACVESHWATGPRLSMSPRSAGL